MAQPLSADLLNNMDSWWRAANYLSVGQIYLKDNPLLREPLKLEHIKPRLLGHWGTTPALNFIYVHLNRLIKQHDLDMMYVIGPGHGGPGLVASTYLEGSYTEIYPQIGHDIDGLRRLFKQFSWPYGIPSHVAPETPGSIHEGGELGYSLLHAYGAAFDNPDLIVCCVVGDGEAETGAAATSWHSNKFLNPVRDGAVLPILHLNGYKIANPTVLDRIGNEELTQLFSGYGYEARFVEGREPELMHQLIASALGEVLAQIWAIQSDARRNGLGRRPRWPMIILRTPKGWTGPKRSLQFGTARPVWVSGIGRATRRVVTRMSSWRAQETCRRLRRSRPSRCCGAAFRDLRIRVVNVVDLMTLQPSSEHPHGLADEDFDAIFTKERPIIFAYHGYPYLIHRLTYRRTNHDNLHVRGYKEEGTTTTPFDMTVLNNMDRFQLALDVVRRVPRLKPLADQATQEFHDILRRHKAYVSANGEDLPEVRNWRWDL
jgi:phosphoketolase